MSEGLEWLPALILLDDYRGDWQRYLEAVYAAFVEDFVHTRPASFLGKRFALKRHPLRQGREATFWHFTTEGQVEDARLPDLRRCERIRWPRHHRGA